MAKPAVNYTCTECGYSAGRWFGKCPGCDAFGSLVEEAPAAAAKASAKPILVKNNNLNACASLVADVFQQAVFICMTRDPRFLAQSLLQARVNIHGGEDFPYGIAGHPCS